MWYAFLADVLVAIHVGYVSYVVAGQLAIWLGLSLGCRWARNFWFRVTHLTAIAIVAFEAAFQIKCPLTVWEFQLREMAGEKVEQVSFVARLLGSVIYHANWPSWVFPVLHIGFAVLVLGTFVAFPPRRPGWLGGRSQTARRSQTA